MRKQKDNSGRRIAVLSGILAAVILLYSVRLVDWQLIHKDKYAEPWHNAQGQARIS